MEEMKSSNEKRINIEDIPEGKRAEDYPEGTVFVWKDHEPIESDE